MSEDKGKEIQNNTFSSASNNNNIDEENIMDEQGEIISFDFHRDLVGYESCVCKLIFLKKKFTFTGTGFFCYIPSKDIRVFITNYHVIDDNFLENEKEIAIYYEEGMKEKKKIIDLTLNRAKFTDKTLDVTVLEILDEDLIDNFIEVDEKFIKDKDFEGETVFNLQYPKGGKLKTSTGKIYYKKDINTFEYNAGSESGSSGSPILLYGENKLIGIHRGTESKNSKNYAKKKNIGIYLDKIIPNIKKSSQPENINVIKCLYDIKKEEVDEDIQVYNNINNISQKISSVKIFKEDDVIRRINNGQCRFREEGKYFIFYELDKLVTDLSNMFDNCTSLIKVYMPSFQGNNITDMKNMFNGCSSLKEINFPPSLSTKYVNDMSNLFAECSSIKKIDLSSFNTENVKDMSKLFRGCESLSEIILSPFNTKNVENMSSMFEECENLEELDLSKFNMEKVTYMENMFSGCRKLRNINLKSFNTKCALVMLNIFENCISLKQLDLKAFTFQKVYTMKAMFKGCKSLKEIDLSTFKNTILLDTADMFNGCISLKSIGNCSDKRILGEFEKCKGLKNKDNNEITLEKNQSK